MTEVMKNNAEKCSRFHPKCDETGEQSSRKCNNTIEIYKCLLLLAGVTSYLPYSSRVEWTRDSSSSSSPASLCLRYFLWGLYTSYGIIQKRKLGLAGKRLVLIASLHTTHQHVHHGPRSSVLPLEELVILDHRESQHTSNTAGPLLCYRKLLLSPGTTGRTEDQDYLSWMTDTWLIFTLHSQLSYSKAFIPTNWRYWRMDKQICVALFQTA